MARSREKVLFDKRTNLNLIFPCRLETLVDQFTQFLVLLGDHCGGHLWCEHGNHTGCGGLTSDSGGAGTDLNGQMNDSIAVYSFGLKPEEHQPSGTCNFSRIDNAQLVPSLAVYSCASGIGIDVYAVNYNVLRIMSGMGGLAYSN